MEMNSTNEELSLSRFRKKMEAFVPIPDDDFQQLAQIMHEKHFNKGDVILKEGQVCKYFYFIVSGCIRSFGLENGRDVNVKFYFEDDIACDFISFRRQEPSQFFLVAVEDCIVYCATKTEAEPIFRNTASLHLNLFRFFQELYLKEEEHSNNLKILSPPGRYEFLLENYPQYLQRIPLVHLASYLGISRETLSRIRNKKGRTK